LAALQLVRCVHTSQTGRDVPQRTVAHVNEQAKQLVGGGVVGHLQNVADPQVEATCTTTNRLLFGVCDE
jgi:hypothetical protein